MVGKKFVGREKVVFVAHKIRVTFLGEGELLPIAVSAVLKKNIIPPENIFLSEKDRSAYGAFNEEGITFTSDDINAVMKGEVIVVCAPAKLELSTALARISGTTRGRIVIAICPNIDPAYIAERVSGGTNILAARPLAGEHDPPIAELEYGNGFPAYIRGVCADIVGSIFELR